MRKIQWLKWEDPLEPKKRLKAEFSEEQEQKDSFDYEEDENAKHVRLISGPYGLIPLNEHGLSNKLYKLWVGHTNFDITPKIVSAIEQINGVEILRVWTRYRFWIGIGNMFDVEIVQKQIEDKICNKNKKSNLLVIKNLTDTIKTKNNSWAICCNKKGVLETFIGNSDLDVKKQIIKKNLHILKSSWIIE